MTVITHSTDLFFKDEDRRDVLIWFIILTNSCSVWPFIITSLNLSVGKRASIYRQSGREKSSDAQVIFNNSKLVCPTSTCSVVLFSTARSSYVHYLIVSFSSSIVSKLFGFVKFPFWDMCFVFAIRFITLSAFIHGYHEYHENHSVTSKTLEAKYYSWKCEGNPLFLQYACLGSRTKKKIINQHKFFEMTFVKHVILFWFDPLTKSRDDVLNGYICWRHGHIKYLMKRSFSDHRPDMKKQNDIFDYTRESWISLGSSFGRLTSYSTLLIKILKCICEFASNWYVIDIVSRPCPTGRDGFVWVSQSFCVQRDARVSRFFISLNWVMSSCGVSKRAKVSCKVVS